MDSTRWLSLGGLVAVLIVLVAQRYWPGWRERLIAAGRWRAPEWDNAVLAGLLVSIAAGVPLAILLDDRGAGAILLGIGIGLVVGLCAGRVALVLTRRGAGRGG